MLPSRPLLSPAASAVIRVYPKGRKPGRCRVVANTSVFDRLLALRTLMADMEADEVKVGGGGPGGGMALSP